MFNSVDYIVRSSWKPIGFEAKALGYYREDQVPTTGSKVLMISDERLVFEVNCILAKQGVCVLQVSEAGCIVDDIS